MRVFPEQACWAVTRRAQDMPTVPYINRDAPHTAGGTACALARRLALVCSSVPHLPQWLTWGGTTLSHVQATEGAWTSAPFLLSSGS